MKHSQVGYSKGFHVLVGDSRSQAASMVIDPGKCEGGADNRHKGADQWLYVESGRGEAIVDGRACALETGSLILIERGERHEIRNTGRVPLRTLNFYVPPAYTEEGDELAAGQS